MTARQSTYELIHHLNTRGINVSFDQANTLRRTQLVLQRWAEGECGDSNDYNSWLIERDETTGRPYRCRYPHNETRCYRTRIPDREAGALRRVAAICKNLGLHYYHQTDPRGCALYVDREPLPENNYTRGVACCA